MNGAEDAIRVAPPFIRIEALTTCDAHWGIVTRLESSEPDLVCHIPRSGPEEVGQVRYI